MLEERGASMYSDTEDGKMERMRIEARTEAGAGQKRAGDNTPPLRSLSSD